jgi:hypothetical protein
MRIVAPALIFLALSGPLAAQPTLDASAPTAAELSAGIDGLRDEALQHMGWIYGNLTGLDGPWYDIRRRIGPYGTLYPALVERGNRASNESRFNDWVLIGSRHGFDEAEVTRRSTRISEIFKALQAIKASTN